MNDKKKYYQPEFSMFLLGNQCVLSESNGDNSFATDSDFVDWW